MVIYFLLGKFGDNKSLPKETFCFNYYMHKWNTYYYNFLAKMSSAHAQYAMGQCGANAWSRIRY